MMSYLDNENWYGICAHAESCENNECSHHEKHPHHVWGSEFAGGPWSCILQAHHCPHKEIGLILCRKV